MRELDLGSAELRPGGRAKVRRLGIVMVLSVGVVACEDPGADDEDGTSEDAGATWTGVTTTQGTTTATGETSDPTTGALPPQFIVSTTVSSPEGASTYVKVLDSLAPGHLDLSTAREFPGWSDLKVNAGKVFVSSGEEPLVTRFSVDDAGALIEEGRLSFMNYSESATMFLQAFVDANTAFLATDAGLIRWDPTALTISGTIDYPLLEPREGIEPGSALDRGIAVRDGFVFHPISWIDTYNFVMAPTSQIVVVDVATNAVVSVLDVPCPNIDFASKDAAGNLYFSNWVYSPGATLIHGDAAACAVRILAGSLTLDPTWTLEFRTVTGGHEAAAMTIIDDTHALVSVFHEERAPFDPAVDDFYTWILGANWRFAILPLAGGPARDLVGIEWNAGGYNTARTFEDLYILVPGEDYASTAAYRLGADGVAHPSIDMDGWSNRLVQLR